MSFAGYLRAFCYVRNLLPFVSNLLVGGAIVAVAVAAEAAFHVAVVAIVIIVVVVAAVAGLGVGVLAVAGRCWVLPVVFGARWYWLSLVDSL